MVMTAFGTIHGAVDAVKRGAENYLTKPLQPDAVTAVIERAMEKAQPLHETRALRDRLRERTSRAHRLGRPEDAGGAGARGPGRAEQGERAHHGRERDGQGAGRRGASTPQPAREDAVRAPPLRGARRVAARERALRARARRVHRRRRAARRALQAGRRRDALPRRDRRDPRRRRRSSSCGSSRSGRSSASAATRRCGSTCASSPRPTGTSTRRSQGGVPRGPLLPAERRLRRAPPAARAARRRPPAREFFLRPLRRRRTASRSPASPTRRQPACGLPVARQRPRARERDRAGGRALRRPRIDVRHLPPSVVPAAEGTACRPSPARRSRSSSATPS